MLVTLILASLATVSGTLVTRFFDARASFHAQLCSGVAIGFAALSFFGFIAAFFVPFDWIVWLCIGLACVLPSLLLSGPTLRSVKRHFFLDCVRNLPQSAQRAVRRMASYFVFYVLIGLLLCLAFSCVI